MDLTITPDPSPDEHAAIAAALEAFASEAQPAAYRSGWRAEGIRENSGDAEADEG